MNSVYLKLIKKRRKPRVKSDTLKTREGDKSVKHGRGIKGLDDKSSGMEILLY
jgi:hypothetical protein